MDEYRYWLRRVRVDVLSHVETVSPERLSFLDELYQNSKNAACHTVEQR